MAGVIAIMSALAVNASPNRQVLRYPERAEEINKSSSWGRLK